MQDFLNYTNNHLFVGIFVSVCALVVLFILVVKHSKEKRQLNYKISHLEEQVKALRIEVNKIALNKISLQDRVQALKKSGLTEEGPDEETLAEIEQTEEELEELSELEEKGGHTLLKDFLDHSLDTTIDKVDSSEAEDIEDLKKEFDSYEEPKGNLEDDLETAIKEREFQESQRRAANLKQEKSEKEILSTKLTKTRTSFFSKLKNLFSKKDPNEKEFFESLEEILVSSDLGIQTVSSLIQDLKNTLSDSKKQTGQFSEELATSILKEKIAKILEHETSPEIVIPSGSQSPFVILVIGVNGAGKTTTIGKLSNQFAQHGKKVMIAACDTFRAAAKEQVGVWADRANVDLEFGDENVKPSTVAYNALDRAKKEGHDIVIIDTAGRLHNRVNLMNELEGVVNVVKKAIPEAPHETILVLDGTTGQNALQQAREFSTKVKTTGIIITKLDGTPKGGIVVAIKAELGIPIRYIGVGEGIEDLRLFSPVDFVEAFFDGANLADKTGIEFPSNNSSNDNNSISPNSSQDSASKPVQKVVRTARG